MNNQEMATKFRNGAKIERTKGAANDWLVELYEQAAAALESAPHPLRAKDAEVGKWYLVSLSRPHYCRMESYHAVHGISKFKEYFLDRVEEWLVDGHDWIFGPIPPPSEWGEG